jgi:hypothetical protein
MLQHLREPPLKESHVVKNQFGAELTLAKNSQLILAMIVGWIATIGF